MREEGRRREEEEADTIASWQRQRHTFANNVNLLAQGHTPTKRTVEGGHYSLRRGVEDIIGHAQVSGWSYTF